MLKTFADFFRQNCLICEYLKFYANHNNFEFKDLAIFYFFLNSYFYNKLLSSQNESTFQIVTKLTNPS